MIKNKKLSRKSRQVIVSREGHSVDFNLDPLLIKTSNCTRTLSLALLEEAFGPYTLNKLCDYLAFLLERWSPATAFAFYDGLKVLASLRVIGSTVEFTDNLLHRFSSYWDNSNTGKHPARKIRTWLLWDAETSDAPLLTARQAAIVSGWKFKDTTPYAAIRQGKDGVGPLSRIEDKTLRGEVGRNSHDAQLFGGLTDIQIRTLIALIRGLGSRPTQLCYTKIEDLRIWDHGGNRTGVLLIPEVKDGEAPRAHFRRRRLTPSLLQMIEESILERPPDAIGEWLFCRQYPINGDLGDMLDEDRWRSRSLDQCIARWIESRGLKSNDGEILKAHPRRLRYTYATELAPRMSPMELAHALGHKDQRSIMHYYTFGDDFFSRLANIDGATRWGLAATSFTGRLTDNQPDKQDGGAILFGPQLPLGETPILDIGRCGALTRCHLFPPLSCYGCHRFRPDPDADHLAVLRVLINWRNSRPQTVGKTNDPLQAQLDDVIEAAGYLVGILPAFHWTREQLRNLCPRPSISDIAQAVDIPIEVIAADGSIQALLESWPPEGAGAARLRTRNNKVG